MKKKRVYLYAVGEYKFILQNCCWKVFDNIMLAFLLFAVLIERARILCCSVGGAGGR